MFLKNSHFVNHGRRTFLHDIGFDIRENFETLVAIEMCAIDIT